MHDNIPIYNSRLIRQVSECLMAAYPDIDLNAIYKYAGLSLREINETGHWVTQRQSDLFYTAIQEQTGTTGFANDFGRRITESMTMGLLRQYVLGLISPTAVYLATVRLAPLVTCGAAITAKSLGPCRVEITSTPKTGVHEKSYQCEFRKGTLECLAKSYTGKYAQVEHPECIFRGDRQCRYIARWEITPDLKWKKWRNIFILLSVLASTATFFFLPVPIWGYVPVSCSIFLIVLSIISFYYKIKSLSESIHHQGEAAKSLINEINAHHDHSMFINRIGFMTAAPRYFRETVLLVIHMMEEHLDFQCGFVLLADEDNTVMKYIAGYGVLQKHEKRLRQIEIYDTTGERNIYQRCFITKEAFLFNDLDTDRSELPMRCQPSDHTRSLICVPIVHEFTCYGVLVAANDDFMRDLDQTDLGVVSGVASRIALSIANTAIFNNLVKSERSYRTLIENAGSIIMKQTPGGDILFLNEFAQNYFGYTEEKVLSKNVIGVIFPETAGSKNYIRNLAESFQQNPDQRKTRETMCLMKNGGWGWVVWTHQPIFDGFGVLKEILCVGNDMTALKSQIHENRGKRFQRQHAEKMAAVGTFAGGVAQDFSDILKSIIQNVELAYKEIRGSEIAGPALLQVLESGRHANDIVNRVLSFAGMSDISLSPLHLADIVSEAVKILKNMLPSTIVIKEEFTCPDAFIMGNNTRIQELLINLCKNAVQAMAKTEQGCIKISLAMVGRRIRLSVKDNGNGISPDIMDRIFDPYFTTHVGDGGKGLGLSIVQRIVQDHKGEIDVESWPDIGTTVHIYFPVLGATDKYPAKPLNTNGFATAIQEVPDQQDRDEDKASGQAWPAFKHRP